ncbi:MAG: arginine--tRNA ligase [Candidatus Korarchaeum sp.]|nr:arginine--tRNA ligase [Candidatus Korarchaeum sp.]
MIRDPLGAVKSTFVEEVNRVLGELGSTARFSPIQVSRVRKDYASYGLPVGFKVARELNLDPERAAETVLGKIDMSKIAYSSDAYAESGYLNLRVDKARFFRDVLRLASSEELGRGERRGVVGMVEHTSANPVHPLHVGSGRNAVIGDSFSRILDFLGWDVRRHYLVNDCNLQVAILVAGRSKVRDLIPKGKADHWFGLIYAISNAFLEIWRIKNGFSSESELEEWNEVIERIGRIEPELLRIGELSEEEVMSLLRRYQRKEGDSVQMFREITESVIRGFVETLERMGITHDSFDWESELIWNGWVDRAIEKLERTGYLKREGKAAYVDLWEAAKGDENVRKVFELSEDDISKLEREGRLGEVIPRKFYLTRSDGTWLYTGTDVAYSLYKFEGLGVSFCYNVIASEQNMEQKGVRACLALMGHDPGKLVHLSYEMVNLVGAAMSGRRGLYITLDEVLDEAKRRVEEILRERGIYDEEICEKVAVGALRYGLISVSPSKVVQFRWERVLNLEENSGPFIQYAYTRALNIIKKAQEVPEDFDPNELKSDAEITIVQMISEFPERVWNAFNLMRPDIIASYANELASQFNKFYEGHPVLSAARPEERAARLNLVNAVRGTLGLAMDLIGIPRLERM